MMIANNTLLKTASVAQFLFIYFFQIFVRQKNCACSRAPENPIKAVRRMKTSPLTPQEKALIEEGLKIYKLDWTAVWQYMVPHRDPSILPRQYRTAIGDQKSYKGDEHTKAKRRLYESQKRMSKLGGSRLQATAAGQNIQHWPNTDEANPLPSFPTNCGTDSNNGDDGGNNEDEAYVHEAFLADWRPVLSGENPQVELFTQNQLTNFHPQNLSNNGSSHRYPVNFLRPEVSIRPYRARKANCSRVVKLAPDLPPVNLPPTVRIMSQSAFSKFQGESSKVVQNVVISQPRFGQDDERNNAGEKGDSDLQLHPLLFEGHDDASLPYYPLTGSTSSSGSFDFFPNNPLNLNLFRYPNQGKQTVNFFDNNLKSSELSSPFTGVDFHPLLQRSDDGNTNPTAVNVVVPRSPNELDLDIRLSSSSRNENGASGREPGGSHGLAEDNRNDPDLGPGSVGGRHDEIVMEQEELSDSEDDDVAESVEFECEEMTDTEGDTGSDSDHVENAQDDSLPKVMVHGDDSDQDEPRCQEAATSNEPTSLFGLRLNSKLPVTRRSSKKTALPNQQLDAAAQAKKPRKRAQKPDPR
ncbi:uncharacterized protein LOC143574695 [Bidens hawaiensis]|uniref:uncharacterized protein LOC143574695 n=1 Tax=Bidens hawaiensis TaxID=980011 RepID=UPI00404923E2